MESSIGLVCSSADLKIGIQSLVIFKTFRTIRCGVSFGPDLNFTGFVCPLAIHLMCEPPTTTTSIFTFFLNRYFMKFVPQRLAVRLPRSRV